MNLQFTLKKIVNVQNKLGEGVLWRQSDQSLWWTDIEASILFKMTWIDGVVSQYDLPERLGSFGFVQGNDDVIIAGFSPGFAFFEPSTNKLEWLSRPKAIAKDSGCRLNDGRVGPDGAFWCGSMIENNHWAGKDVKTGLYKFSISKQMEKIFDGLKITNGICWSPCGSLIFVADSTRGTVFKADFDPLKGKCGILKEYIRLPDVSPDGAVTDSSGRYWSALWGGERVACFNSEGIEVSNIPIPALQPTCLSFCGPDLNHIAVTSAWQGLTPAQRERWPNSGDLFIFETNIVGNVPKLFLGSKLKGIKS